VAPNLGREEVLPMAQYRYICRSWQGFVQQVVTYLSNAYWHYCIVRIPDEKIKRVTAIDAKLLSLYNCYMSKDQRYRRKQKGFANYHYIRWNNLALIVHTEGSIPDTIKGTDRFKGARVEHLIIPVSNNLSLKAVHSQQGWTVCMDRNTYRDIKYELYELIRSSSSQYEVIRRYRKLNGIPAWRGVIEQRKHLQRYVIAQLQKQKNIRMRNLDLLNNTKRRQYPVFI